MDFSPWNCETMNFCLRHSVCGTFYRNLSKLRQSSCKRDAGARCQAKPVMFKASSNWIGHVYSQSIRHHKSYDQGWEVPQGLSCGAGCKGSECLQNIFQSAPIRHTSLANIRRLEDSLVLLDSPCFRKLTIQAYVLAWREYPSLPCFTCQFGCGHSFYMDMILGFVSLQQNIWIKQSSWLSISCTCSYSTTAPGRSPALALISQEGKSLLLFEVAHSTTGQTSRNFL